MSVKERDPSLMNLFFHRGAFVRWLDLDHREGIQTFFGIIECEHTHRPGLYYVRAEDGELHVVKWDDLKLASHE
jgi:hypothetical protein